MIIDHVHFFVEDAASQGDWFVRTMGWNQLAQVSLPDRELVILGCRSTIFLFSSPSTSAGSVADRLRDHGSGVADIGIQVQHLEQALHPSQADLRSDEAEAFLHSAVLCELDRALIRPRFLSWARVAGWGSLSHTLIERRLLSSPAGAIPVQGVIDHVVLNVPAGELSAATEYYQGLLGLRQHRHFSIQSQRSGLKSQVLVDPIRPCYFNINEPVSANSQIQAFLDAHHGAGIQHIAIRSDALVADVAAWRRRGLPLLPVPASYFCRLTEQLRVCPTVPITPQEWRQIIDEGILIDWNPEKPDSILLQIFSQQIFPRSHFFLEFIERRAGFDGFGERNFQALYEAIEADSLDA